MRCLAVFLSCLLGCVPLAAQEAPLGLSAPQSVSDTGLLRYILPRFSLKTGIRLAEDSAGAIRLTETTPGTPVFERDGTVYYLSIPDDPRAQRFSDWLVSDIGRRTVDAFEIDGAKVFSSTIRIVEEETGPRFEGDVERGAQASLMLCGRCHVIGPQNAKNSIGSTPSFAVLRTLPDWDTKFQIFYVLAPHPAFTQVIDVTDPFDPARPSPIVPVEMTVDDLEAILAYVATVPAADLGAPLQYQ